MRSSLTIQILPLPMRIRFGETDRMLRVETTGESATAPRTEILMRPREGWWQAHDVAPTSPGDGERTAIGSVLLSPVAPQNSYSHPMLPCELWFLESIGNTKRGITLVWEGPEPLPWAERLSESGNDNRMRRNLPSDGVGAAWVQVGEARLSLGMFPAKMIDPAEFLSQAPRESVAIAEAAVQQLRRILDDLWNFDPTLLDARSEAAGGIGFAKDQVRVPSWAERLRRLHNLVYNKGDRDSSVRDSWYALMADAEVRLTTEYPIVVFQRARRPVLHGNRGPWTLDGGWRPDRPDGLVRDRRVERSSDTPPNRLALALAARVRLHLDQIERDALVEAPSEWEDSCYVAISAQIRDLCTAVDSWPPFREVRREALLDLGSPTLQANRRCRGLLQAWTAMDAKMGRPPDDDLADLMLTPIPSAPLLYERWCYVYLGKILEKVAMSDGKGSSPWQRRFKVGDTVVVLAYTARPTRRVGYDEPLSKAATSEISGGLLDSFSPVSEPDGVLIVTTNGVTTLHIWDAKYRPIFKEKKPLSGDLYQAHAFRDALRWRPTQSTASIKPAWSLVLHPGAIAGTPGERNYPAPDDECGHGGGVALLSTNPDPIHRNDFEIFVRTLCTQRQMPTPRRPSAD